MIKDLLVKLQVRAVFVVYKICMCILPDDTKVEAIKDVQRQWHEMIEITMNADEYNMWDLYLVEEAERYAEFNNKLLTKINKRLLKKIERLRKQNL